MNWLEKLKAGDLVAVENYWGKRLETVTATTKLAVRIGQKKFLRTTGEKTQSRDFWDGIEVLREATPEVVEQLRARDRRWAKICRIRAVDMTAMSEDQLERIAAIVEEKPNERQAD